MMHEQPRAIEFEVMISNSVTGTVRERYRPHTREEALMLIARSRSDRQENIELITTEVFQ